jgi:hypothetical protein
VPPKRKWSKPPTASDPNQLSIDDDITQNYHRGNTFSFAAHQSVKPDKVRLRLQVVAFISTRDDGATCDEVEQALHLSHQTVSARFTEAKALGEIALIGRRPTRTGRSAGVYKATPPTNR